MGSKHSTRFRITPLRPWFLAVGILGIPVSIGAIVMVLTGDAGNIPGLALGFLAVSGLLAIPITLAVLTSTWDVDAEGIGGRDNYHIYRRVDWSEIDSVSPMLIPGYPLLWVNANWKRKAFWLPLFFTDMRGLRHAVARNAPEDNPLRRYLERHQG
jgi:hypothetical protein